MPIPNVEGPLVRQSAKEKVYETVREWIIRGTLEPGEQLYDAKLAEYFHLSRTPVREALLLLETEGLVSIRAGRATTVSEISPERIRECYEPLSVLQALAAELACACMEEEALAALEELNGKFMEAARAGDAWRMIERDRAFHRKIFEIAGNQYIMRFCETLLSHVARIEYAYFSVPEAGVGSAYGHVELIELFRKRDSRRAGERLRKGVLRAMRAYEEAMNLPHK